MKRFLALTLALIVCLAAVSALADVYEDAGFLKKIPLTKKYKQDVEPKGTVEKITYTTRSFALEALNPGTEITADKDLYVYLPAGYDGSEPYNVLYLMHGGGENECYWLVNDPTGKNTVLMLDNIFFQGDVAPTIIVTPTTNIGEVQGDEEELETKGADGCSWYWKELRETVIPLIETRYATFAQGDVSEENLIATRDHRAFAGFSMGSITTFSVTMHDVDIIAYFGNYSGAKTDANEFAATLNSEAFRDYPILFWYNGNGDGDMAHDEHQQFFQDVLSLMPERYMDGVNCCWIDFKGGAHAYTCWQVDLFNCLRVFFK